MGIAVTVRKRPARSSRGLGEALFRYRFSNGSIKPESIDRFIATLEEYGNKGEKMQKYYRLRDAVRADRRDLVPLEFFLS
jgi:hypothetical protein